MCVWVCECVGDPPAEGLLRGVCVGGGRGESWLPPVARAGSCCPDVPDGADVGGGGGSDEG